MNSHTYTDDYGNVFPWEGPVGDYYRRGQNTSRLPEVRTEVFVYQFDLSCEADREEYAKQLTDIANGSLSPVSDRHIESEGALKAILITRRRFACDPGYVKGKEETTGVDSVEVVDESPEVPEASEAVEESDSLPAAQITMSSLTPAERCSDNFAEEESPDNG